MKLQAGETTSYMANDSLSVIVCSQREEVEVLGGSRLGAPPAWFVTLPSPAEAKDTVPSSPGL